MSALIDWLNSPAFFAFGAPTSWAEVLGFITGALCVYLVATQHILNWPIGIANNLLWILLFATAGLYADSGLQVVFIALAVYGWYQWLHGGANKTEEKVSSTSLKEWMVLAGIGAAGLVGLFLVLEHWTNSTVPFWDALTTTVSLLAVWGQAKKRWESWLLWMAVDIIYVPLYIHKGLTLTGILYVGFFLICVKGLISWRRDLKAQRTLVAGTPQLAAVDA